MLIKRNLEKTPDYTKTALSNSEICATPDMKPALPPKTKQGPRPPIYQRPIDHNYTPFPDHHRRAHQNDFVDQYSHLQGGHLGGNRSGKKKDYYPVTHLGSPAHSGSRVTPTFSQEHQYMPIVHSDSSPSQSPAGATRARQHTTSSQGSVPVFNDPALNPGGKVVSNKGKYRVPRSLLAEPDLYHEKNPSNSPYMDRDESDLPPPYSPDQQNTDIEIAVEGVTMPPASEQSRGAEHETGV